MRDGVGVSVGEKGKREEGRREEEGGREKGEGRNERESG